MKPDLSVKIGKIRLETPVMNAAGTFELDIYERLTNSTKIGLGVHIPKSVTWKPRLGNPQPRSFEVPAGLINSIGLQNLGAVDFVRERLPVISRIADKFGIPLILNIAGDSIDDFVRTAVLLEEKARIVGFEINISCPNVANGLVFGTDPKLTSKLINALRKSVSLPLWVKLTPNVTDIGLIARAAVDAGADALSLINTVKARAYIKKGPSAKKWIVGGLSGPAIHSIALQKVAEVLAVVKVPVIGIGGITNTENALDFFRLEVKAVQVGTANFLNPAVIAEIADGLEEKLKEVKDERQTNSAPF